MTKPVLSLSLATALCLPLVAQATQPVAVVAKIDGYAVATQGERYVTVHDGMKLIEGDRLMVLEGGLAVVTYRDGCRLDLPEMAILSVQASSTCALNGVGVYQPDPQSGVAAGTPPNPQLAAIGSKKPSGKAGPGDGRTAATGTGSGGSPPPKPPGSTPPKPGSNEMFGGSTMIGSTSVPNIFLLPGLLALTGGTTYAISRSNNNNSNPLSP